MDPKLSELRQGYCFSKYWSELMWRKIHNTQCVQSSSATYE